METTSPAGSQGVRRPSGFSLVELLVVASIMGLLAGVAAMSLRSLRSPALASAANEVASAMKMARQMAIASAHRTFVVFPISANPLTTNLFRTYAIFEEIPPGDQTSRPTASGTYFTNPTTATKSWYIPRTDWRTLPEGVVFCNLATATYNTINLDPFTGLTLGQLFQPMAQPGSAGSEWKFFESFQDFDIRREDSATTSLATLSSAPFLAFYPGGRAYYINIGNRQGAGLRLVQGFAKGNQIAVTDTNNFYTVEIDSFVGRVRVRNRESYR
ncbi:MAG: prepilin-type N-terminal cleavage/methylation domain-containing protein [Verrucomicrobia bacterium]|nr:prepilin-type N-terminal cleavage/methylation domain-containing protein [Verrucomicrobiota bacterium]